MFMDSVLCNNVKWHRENVLNTWRKAGAKRRGKPRHRGKSSCFPLPDYGSNSAHWNIQKFRNPLQSMPSVCYTTIRLQRSWESSLLYPSWDISFVTFCEWEIFLQLLPNHGLLPTSGESFTLTAVSKTYLLTKIMTCSIPVLPVVYHHNGCEIK